MSTNKTHKFLVIGISGVTCAGKTTIATQLNNIFPSSKVFSQDDYFLDVDDPRHKWIHELNHINFDIVSSLDMDKMHSDILNYVKTNNLKRMDRSKNETFITNDLEMNDLPKDIHKKLKELNTTVLIVEGFSIFNYKPMLDLFDLKYYFTLSKEACYERRILRVYEPPDCPGYFEKCVWPEYLVLKEEVVNSVDGVKYFHENTGDKLAEILADINQYL